mmetsp:Transcript_24267/g.75124  ORF Transcript_24267/g.75124 Transcript_24267/m.75124 type:complete len:234 (-) Transcript_24267:584-1285(-)
MPTCLRSRRRCRGPPPSSSASASCTSTCTSGRWSSTSTRLSPSRRSKRPSSPSSASPTRTTSATATPSTTSCTPTTAANSTLLGPPVRRAARCRPPQPPPRCRNPAGFRTLTQRMALRRPRAKSPRGTSRALRLQPRRSAGPQGRRLISVARWIPQRMREARTPAPHHRRCQIGPLRTSRRILQRGATRSRRARRSAAARTTRRWRSASARPCSASGRTRASSAGRSRRRSSS